MRLVRKIDFPEMQFSLYFLGYLNEEEAGQVPADDAKRLTFTFGREAMLELTHNWGTEDDADFAYHDGNAQPQGFGHIGITVPDVYAAAERFEKLDVEFVKRPDDGKKRAGFYQGPGRLLDRNSSGRHARKAAKERLIRDSFLTEKRFFATLTTCP